MHQAAPDTNSPFLRAIQDQYNIQIMFRSVIALIFYNVLVGEGCYLGVYPV